MDASLDSIKSGISNLVEALILQHREGTHRSDFESLKIKLEEFEKTLKTSQKALQNEEHQLDNVLAAAYALNKLLKQHLEQRELDQDPPSDEVDLAKTPKSLRPTMNYLNEGTPNCMDSLAVPLQTPMSYYSLMNQENSAPIQTVSEEEFKTVPSYMKGILKVNVVNKLISDFNKVLELKYDYMKKPRSSFSSNEKLYNAHRDWQKQQKNFSREMVCIDDDFPLLINMKILKKESNIITILRHLKRLRQTKIKNITFYISPSFYD